MILSEHDKRAIVGLERVYVQSVAESVERVGITPAVALAALLNGVVRALSLYLSKEHAVRWLRELADEVERDAVETTTVH